MQSLNQKLLNKIEKLRNKNTPPADIVKIIGMSSATVSNYVKVLVYQGKIKQYKARKLNNEFLNKVDELRGKGKKLNEMAEILCVSTATITNYLRILFAQKRQNYLTTEEIIEHCGLTLFNRTEEAKELRKQGVSNVKIALILGTSDTTIKNRLGTKINFLTTKQLKIKELKEQGKTNSEIAIIMGVSKGTINQQGSRLRKRGIIPSLVGRPRPLKEFILTSKFQTIINLVNRGFKNKHIANIIDISTGGISYSISLLIKNGYLEKRKRGRPKLIP